MSDHYAPAAISHSRPWITAADKRAVDRVLDSGMLAAGEIVRKFETALADRCGLAAAKFVPTGRAAMFRALKLVGVAPSDEVIIPTYVCPSVAAAVRACDAIPILCDIGNDWCLDPEKALALRTDRTRAIVVAHMFGISARLETLLASGIPVIEDCAQALGGVATNGSPLGSLGVVSVYSFGPTKPLTSGSGGFVGTSNPTLASVLTAGSRADWQEASAPVSDLQAALGLSQLERLEEATVRRAHLAACYFENLSACEGVLPAHISGRSIFYRFPITVFRPPEALIEAFAGRGVSVRRGVDALLHRRAGLPATSFEEAEKRFGSTISIPLYPALTDEDAARVIQAVQDELAPSK